MLRKFIKWLKYRLSHEWCYDQMEERGVAAFGCCCGLAGGSKATNYLSEMCCDCPHWTLTDGERIMIMPFFCYNKKDYCANPADCDNCDVFVLGKGGKEVPSHADRIRAMSDEELAWELMTWRLETEAKHHGVESNYTNTQATILEWLKQPAEVTEDA